MEQINKNDFLNNVQGIINEMKNQVDAYANQVFENNMAAKQAESAEYCLENIINKNGINLRESIKNIVSSEASSNAKLMETIEQYAGALNNGLYEERLYESFINNISKFDYLLPVENEIKRINETVSSNEKPITITKILEEMTTTPSYYIIPMIEEDACRYVKNPTDTNRVQLRAILCSFASDPYCNLMLNTLEHKDDIYGKTLSEKAMSINDKIKFVRQNANVSQIYSPVQYIKENESVFNANGYFFVKKGNTIATLPQEYLNQLSEKFLSLCQLVNDPHVTMFDDHIVLAGNDKVASIYEDYIDINGNRESKDALRNINEMAMKYDFDNNFFIMASSLCENFDNIAIINFGKHIELNNDNGVNVDMFRVGNNIYVNAVNENLMHNVFYQNVNPIQCRNLINKHMGINVASLFEDLIPSQEKVLVKLNEAKTEYEESIAKYEESIKKLKDAKDKCTSEDNIKKLDDALKSAEDKLKELKDEYKEWQKKAKDATEVPESEDTSEKKDSDSNDNNDSDNNDSEENNDDNTEVEKGSEPIDADEVDAAKPELTQPLQNDMNNDTDLDGNITDDEFDSYLEGDSNPESAGEEVPADEIPAEEPVTAEDMPSEETDDENMPSEETDDENMPSEETGDEGFTEMPSEENPADVDGIDTDNEEDIEGVATEEPESEDTVDFDQMSNDIDNEFNDGDLNNDSYITPETQAEGYKIASITFDQNVKTGELFKTGTIIVITPMIDGNGKMYAESNNYDFYIDEATHHPVINTPGVPVALYNAMYNAVLTDPGFAKADKEGAANIEGDYGNDPDNSDIWYDADDVNKVSDEIEKDDDEFFNFIDDKANNSFTVTAKEDNNEDTTGTTEMPEDKAGDNDNMDDDNTVLSDIFNGYDSNEYSNDKNDGNDVSDDPIPTYKSGDTEIELPAATTDGTNIPEISSDEIENPEKIENDDADVPSEIDFDKELNEPADNDDDIDFDKEFANLHDKKAGNEGENGNENENTENDEDDTEDDDAEEESEHVTMNESKIAMRKLRNEQHGLLNESNAIIRKLRKEQNSRRKNIVSINEKFTHKRK